MKNYYCPKCGKRMEYEAIDNEASMVCGCGYSEHVDYEPDIDLQYDIFKEVQHGI